MKLLPPALAVAAAWIAVGCVVSGFEKVPDPGGGGTGGTGGSAPQCPPGCPNGPNDEPACCFGQPGPNTNDECGYRIEGNVCLPPNVTGPADSTCPGSARGEGCCLQNGLCGYLDTQHGLGCMPTEAFGDAPKACSSNPCGAHCVREATLDCSGDTHPMKAWSCAQVCTEFPCVSELGQVVDKCEEFDYCLANGSPGYLVADPDTKGCTPVLYDLTKCLAEKDSFGPECTLYCSLVTTACVGSELQYAGGEECLNVCGKLFDATALPYGSFTNLTQNSLTCRLAAIGDMTTASKGTHPQACAGAGPAGDFGIAGGVKCGEGLCESYCTLMRAACPTQFNGDHSSVDQCMTACAGVNGGSPETFAWVSQPSGDTISCRLNQLLRAVTNPSSCASARLTAPGAPCQ